MRSEPTAAKTNRAVTCANCKNEICPDALYAAGPPYRWHLLCRPRAATVWCWSRFRDCRYCGRRRYYSIGWPRGSCTDACADQARRARSAARTSRAANRCANGDGEQRLNGCDPGDLDRRRIRCVQGRLARLASGWRRGCRSAQLFDAVAAGVAAVARCGQQPRAASAREAAHHPGAQPERALDAAPRGRAGVGIAERVEDRLIEQRVDRRVD